MVHKIERPLRFVFEIYGGDPGFAKRYVVDLEKGMLYRDEEFVPTLEVKLNEVQCRRISDALVKSRVLNVEPEPAMVIGGTAYAILMYFSKGSVQKEWTCHNRDVKGYVIENCLDRIVDEFWESRSGSL